MLNRRALFRRGLRGLGAAAVITVVATAVFVRRPPDLGSATGASRRPLLLDRTGQPIRISYADDWNLAYQKPLGEFPTFIVDAIVSAEDNRFYEHKGVDWRARASALAANLRSLRGARGASTITEQVVRMLHPRPRNLWSKWIEGWEAVWLETRETKERILEFYLNQVPYSHRRRGVQQAARFYFGRDLSTLNLKEALALAAMIKSPVRLDLKKAPEQLASSIDRLAQRMRSDGKLSAEQLSELKDTPLVTSDEDLSVDASHFVGYAESRITNLGGRSTFQTTLHPEWQNLAQGLLDEYLATNKRNKVENAAVVVLDHQSDEIVVWAVGAKSASDGSLFNAPLVPRQPGSTLKPFLYGLAFENGWTAASLIEDAPFASAVGSGTHQFRNYSRVHYGWITLREALANSLNIPAVKLVQKVGVDRFRTRLNELGIRSLQRPTDDYGDGLALGNGEISLLELVRGYSTLARGGIDREPRVFLNEVPQGPGRQVFTPEAASLVGHILSDKYARRLEFGRSNSMEFPVQTAIKTGTSTDYRDAWVFAYNYRFVVGVWMGNMSHRPTNGLTGAAGPVMVARSLMAKLTKNDQTQALYRSPKLFPKQVCRNGNEIVRFDGGCAGWTELFADGTEIQDAANLHAAPLPFRLVKPTSGLHMAIDPRIPIELQQYAFEVDGHDPKTPIVWRLDGEELGKTQSPKILWQIKKGQHRIEAVQVRNGQAITSERAFMVK